jgi:thiol-disulfide isomerase/thioredoxin
MLWCSQTQTLMSSQRMANGFSSFTHHVEKYEIPCNSNRFIEGCGHCKKLAPTYEEVATTLKGKINVGKVDCTVEKGTQLAFILFSFTSTFRNCNEIWHQRLSNSQIVSSFLLEILTIMQCKWWTNL